MKIILVNAITKQKIVYLHYPSHSTLNYSQMLRIIKIFEHSLKPQHVLIQFRNSDGWRYIHHQFSINISHIQEQLHIRYKIYKETVLTPDDRKIINKQVDLCVQKLKIYKNIDTNIIDFNFFWASPFEKEILNYNCSDPNTEGTDRKEHNLIDWKIRTNGYFKQLGQAIRIKKKKALLYINTFNSECFKYRTEYQIVYIVCHTEKEQNGSDEKYYLVGEQNGVLNKIFVQDFYKMLEQKRIQLLILYTSCMSEHIKLLKENKNIQNILLINESPLHQQKSILLYMKQFIKNLLIGQSIKKAHELSVEKIVSDLQTKFILIQKQDKKFQFNDGELQGDYIYLKGFTNKNKLLSNRILLIQLIRTFCFDENNSDCPNFSYKIFNAYNERCSDKSVFIPEIKCQLIKRKLFKEVIIQTSLGWQTVNFKPRDSDTLYMLFGDKFSSVEIKKLQKLCVNALLLTNQDLNMKKYDPHYNSSLIQPLNRNESLHFLKYHRKLTKNMEQKVQKFIQFTWKEDLKHLYYPFNFDYNALMSIIAQFNITNVSQHTEYENFKLLVRKLSQQKFSDYLFVMTIINHAHENQKGKLIQMIKNLNFYKDLKNNFPEGLYNDENFLRLNNKYFRTIYQDFFHQIYSHLSQILLNFVKSTIELDTKGESLNRRSIWFYEATTLTKRSQLSILLKRSQGMGKKYENILVSSDIKQFLKECDGFTLINTGLNIAKNILSFFDIFDSKVNKNEQPTDLLLLCLLMVNNALIYRKSTEVLKSTQRNNGNMEIVFKQKKKKQVVLNEEKDETKNYFQQQEQETQQYENKKKSRFLKCINGFFTKRINQKEDSRFYSEEDFVIKVDCLTRKGLLFILSKIRNKLDESTQLLAVCNSLAIQLEIQPGYQGKAFDQDNLSVLLKQSQLAMDNWAPNDLPGKYRIGYDILMCLILVNTQCGREKMNQCLWQKINHHQKEIFYRQLLQIPTLTTGEQRYFEIYLKHLCQSRQMHQQLIEHMRNFTLFQSEEQRQEQISKQYYIVIQLWSKCNEYIKNIQSNMKSSQYFSKLLKLKQDLSQKLRKKQYTEQFHMYSMLRTFTDYVTSFLSEISSKLVIILTNKNMNFEQIIKKCDIDDNQLIIVYFYVNLNEDMSILQQIKCRFLLLSLSNVDIFGEYAEIRNKIYRISCKFIFVCENLIRSKLQEFTLKNQYTKKYIIFYNVEKDQLDEAKISIIMVILSLHIVKQIADFKLEVQEQVYRCIDFILKSSISHNQKDKIERQQRLENATFSMIHQIVNKLKKNLKLHYQKQNQKNFSLTDVDFFINYKKSMVKLDISTSAKGNRDIIRN